MMTTTRTMVRSRSSTTTSMRLDQLTASAWFNTAVGGRYPALFVTWDEGLPGAHQPGLRGALWAGVTPVPSQSKS